MLFLLIPFLVGATSSFEVTVSGTITDADGIPLIGVNIVEVGTSNGTVSDIDGNYSITVADASSLIRYSYTGYASQEFVAGDGGVRNLSLEPDSELLEEVVVVGYGTQKKRDVTGAIATLDEEKISAIPVASGVQAMQGQVSGVDIQSTGGRPGQAPTIRIRGRRSVSASNDPLFVIDGIPQTGGSDVMNDINPQDIASMEILKDAAATAIYGSRGANGVVLITTKRGSEGKTVVSYDGQYGFTNPIYDIDMMNTQQWMALRREAFRSGGSNTQNPFDGTIPSDDVVFDVDHLQGIEAGQDVDWIDQILGTGTQTQHQLGVRGGTAKTQFNMSVGLFNEDGAIDNMDFQRITGRINLDHKINDVFSAGVSFLLSNSKQNWGSGATLGEAIGNIPVGFPYQEDGVTPRFLPTNDGIRTNPLNEVFGNSFVDERRTTRVFAPIYVQANIAEGLVFKSTFGPDIRFRRRGQFLASLTNANRGGPARAAIQEDRDMGFTLENLLTYSKPIGNSNLGVTLLQSIQQLRVEEHNTAAANLPYESQLFYNLGTGAVKGDLFSRLSEWQLASFMGRVNYDIAGKYNIQATLRADGSSRLSGDKWNYFPGLSVGWQIGQDLFQDVSWLNSLKLRASYGEVGNTSVDPYQTAGRLGRTVYSWGGANAFGFGLNEIPNPELNWEVTRTFNLGMDFDILNGRINGSFEWYRANTEDILLERRLPPTSGYIQILQNIGSTRTNGVELMLSAGIVETQDFSWSVDFNISRNTEEIVELALRDQDGNAIDDIGNRWFIGQPLKVIFDYENIGIYGTDEADLAASAENKVPGEIKLRDQDGDGIITADDRVILGTDIPDFFGGLTTNFSYKNFDLSAFLFFRQGQSVISNFHIGANSLFARYNNLNVDYWTIDNQDGQFPRPNQNQERPRNNSTMGIFDGSFVKLRNITLGYNFPESIIGDWGISRLRLYASGQNLWFSSKFDVFDPEIDVTDGDNRFPTIQTSTVPTNSLVLFGLKVDF
ncbi:MAG: TonB-dependent receptor [Saprospiraceae bacterium]|nr:TonB-dependent receptor [Saprospiraceae bacterium]